MTFPVAQIGYQMQERSWKENKYMGKASMRTIPQNNSYYKFLMEKGAIPKVDFTKV